MFVKLLTIFFFFSFTLLSQFPKSSSQTLDFTYNGFLPPLTDISLEGIAAVTPNGLLKLTNYTMQKTGHAFHTKPVRFKDLQDGTVSSFSTTFVFSIHSEIPSLSGYGMAFVIAPNPRLRYATASQYMGLFNITNDGNVTNHVFAIEFDTIQSPKFNDTDDNHVGIDINSLISVESSPAGYWDKNGQFKNLLLISGRRMQVWVDYDGLTHQMDVTMAPYAKDKPKKPLVSIVRDLSSVLQQDMFVGFSSATGTIVSEYYVLGWSFRVKGNARPLDLSKLPKLPRWEPKRIYSIYKTWMPSVCIFFVPFLFISTLIILVRFVMKRRRKFKEELEDWETRLGKNRMKFKDLYCATKGFNESDLLGSGGFGTVYRGVMPRTKKEIAVKRVSNKSHQGLKEFVSEVVSIGRMGHRNLVPLLGYCRSRDELLLVYEYMPNGSLDKYLHNSPPEVTLDWKQRIKVIKGVASALFYLHEEWEQVVIHRDIKASNVLLDSEHNGRLGDFGLARLCGHGSDPQTTLVAGTWGYLAPDHVRTGRATTATDIFAFGVLLLEVACGRRPIEIRNENGERVFILDWVLGFWSEGNILDAKDPKIGTEYDRTEVEMVLKLGLMCTHSNPHDRPAMRQVLHYLMGDAILPDLSPLDLGGNEMLEIHHELSETGMFTCGSSMVNSIVSASSGR
ncbi:L-type lectin-domain containing receptor kinase IV.4 [Raphanus sativus]|uniref:non-specific serine/threonine protein kinase n=1 Tax=Raphanus sativus TaxID=3726 RepID=A0A6J0MV30_RAPSA|nr:L-type lectin-domain containing receptor kinase IV.4-like [Raphanus sativus]KAJ4905451.1 L-type lectin-domain containing receptor kinase IV.4 [Raphanus sativus]